MIEPAASGGWGRVAWLLWWIALLGVLLARTRFLAPLRSEVAALRSEWIPVARFSEPMAARPAPDASTVALRAQAEHGYQQRLSRLRARQVDPSRIPAMLDSWLRSAASADLEVAELAPERLVDDALGQRRIYRLRLLGHYPDLVRWLQRAASGSALVVPADLILRGHPEAGSPAHSGPTLEAELRLEAWVAVDGLEGLEGQDSLSGSNPVLGPNPVSAPNPVSGPATDRADESSRRAPALSRAARDPFALSHQQLRDTLRFDSLSLAGLLWTGHLQPRLALLSARVDGRPVTRTLGIGEWWGALRLIDIGRDAVVVDIEDGGRIRREHLQIQRSPDE